MSAARRPSTPTYETRLGAAWEGDAATLIKSVADASVQVIITSPPFALSSPKKYGNPSQADYVDWLMSFASEFRRVLKPDGSLVIDIGGSWLRGSPTRSIYHFELLVALVREGGFRLAQEFYWYNRAKLPGPAEWVNVRRERVKDAVNPIWWLAPGEHPKADNRRVLRPYSPGMKELFRRGYNAGPRPSGHKVGVRFGVDRGGAIPPNLIEVAHTRSKGDEYQDYCRSKGLVIHPARFPREIPTFFIRFLTEPGDLVLDPFAGSNVTGAVAESLGRRWVAFEKRREYLNGSIGRFLGQSDLRLADDAGALEPDDASSNRPLGRSRSSNRLA